MDKLIINYGELNEGLNKRIRVWYYWISSQKQAKPLSQCPFLTKIGSKYIRDDNINGREITLIYEILAPVTICMAINKTVKGKQAFYKHIFINIDNKKEKISIDGVDGFGNITVRGEVDFKTSFTSEKDLIMYHNYKTITKSKEKTKPRNILM
jgi:hypothetical protein